MAFHSYVFAFILVVQISNIVVADVCHDGWTQFEGSCYLLPDFKETWINAQAYCGVLHKGHLVEINNVRENIYIQSLINASHLSDEVWTGGNDLEKEGKFVWSNIYSNLDYTYWAAGEPNYIGGNEDCVFIERNQYRWNDGHCSDSYHFICEAQPIPVLMPVLTG